jgi:hypothetical protein
MSMGTDSVPGYSAPTSADIKRYGVALGTDTTVMSSVCPSHCFVLGDPTNPDEMFKLSKFLLQSAAETAGLTPIFDPIGKLSGTDAVKIPFDVADTDSNVRLVLLVDDPELVELSLEISNKRLPALEFPGASFSRGKGSLEFALDRGVLEQTARDEEPCKPHKRDPRANPERQGDAPPLPAPSSTWHAVVSLSKTGLERGTRLKPVPYTLLVFADSDLRFGASVHLDNDRVGGTAFLSAWLTEHRAPVTGKRVRVWAEVTYPEGGEGTIELRETVSGRFEAQVRCTQPGTYCYRIRTAGTTFRGKKFQRELTRTTFTRSGSRPDCLPCAPPHHYLRPKSGRRVEAEDDADEEQLVKAGEKAAPTAGNDRAGQLGKLLEALRLARDALR